MGEVSDAEGREKRRQEELRERFNGAFGFVPNTQGLLKTRMVEQEIVHRALAEFRDSRETREERLKELMGRPLPWGDLRQLLKEVEGLEVGIAQSQTTVEELESLAKAFEFAID